MAVFDHIAGVVQLGGCVVMGMGVAPEKYRALLDGVTNQDYMIIGPKDSEDAKFIASQMGGDHLDSKPLSLFGTEMEMYFVRGESSAR